MNKITGLYVFMVLSVITMPTIVFANYLSSSIGETNSNHDERQTYNSGSYSQEEQNQIYDLNSEIIGDRSWETTSSRMNRQAAATNNRFNSNQNRNEQTEDGAWETTSSRMNRQAAAANNRFNSNQNRNEQTGNEAWETTSSRMNRQAAAAHNRSNSTWIREEQNRPDSDAAIRRNTQR